MAKYKAEYCEKIIELMANGMHKTAVCRELKISRFTFYEWIKKHPKFKEAVEEGEFWGQGWWTELGRMAAMGDIEKFNTGPWAMTMKNCFGWKDKVENTHHGKMQIERIERVIVDPKNTDS